MRLIPVHERRYLLTDSRKLDHMLLDFVPTDLLTSSVLLGEVREKLDTLEKAWNGILAGTHDAEIKCNTQRLSTGWNLSPPIQSQGCNFPPRSIIFGAH